MLHTYISQIAYSLLSGGEKEKDVDPIDAHYKKLKTEIDVLEKTTEEFKVIEEYVKNTHASTHTQYSLEIEEVFKVARKGEAKRFKPFRALPNRMLLWHGSRVTNFAGILSQGLRIAPPEVSKCCIVVLFIFYLIFVKAPVTGYMFGKGIYFADMVTRIFIALSTFPRESRLLSFRIVGTSLIGSGEQVRQLLRHQQKEQHWPPPPL